MSGIFTINPFPLIILARFAILLLCTVAFMWLFTVIRFKFSKFEKFNLRISIKNTLLESSLAAIFAFSLYVSLFIILNDWQYFVWNQWRWNLASNIYYMLLPEIIIFLGLNIFFFISISNLSK